jgi:pimeloyl-ACP methyl ester carboxylesterase
MNASTWKRMVTTFIVIVVTLYLGLTLLLFLFQARFIYFPIAAWAATPARIGLPYETVTLTTSDGVDLSAWFIPAPEARHVLLFFHGNAGNISHRLTSIEQFHQLGLAVFIIDYRGYGQSEGSPTEAGTYLDAEAAWRYLIEEQGFKPSQIILFGRSLGGAVATWLAQHRRPAALIIESTFTSVPDMAAAQFPFLPTRLLTRIRYDTYTRLPQVTCPVLVIHSPEDEIIPYSHGERLFAVAPAPKMFLKLKGGHNDGFLLSGPAYEAGLQAFLTRYTGL